MRESEQISIKLSADEALVFFDWLARLNDRRDPDVADPTEQRILWDIECSLESVLIQTFSEDYTSVLAQARSRLGLSKP